MNLSQLCLAGFNKYKSNFYYVVLYQWEAKFLSVQTNHQHWDIKIYGNNWVRSPSIKKKSQKSFLQSEWKSLDLTVAGRIHPQLCFESKCKISKNSRSYAKDAAKKCWNTWTLIRKETLYKNSFFFLQIIFCFRARGNLGKC